MRYNKPFAEKITTEELCQYGCNSPAKYKFKNGKFCCSTHYNSCPGKIKAFSELDHSVYTAKSLETRTRLGITKSSQIKAGKTRKENGHYERLSKKMQEHWKTKPWQNNSHCPILKYKETNIQYQGSHEFEFLEFLEIKNGIAWIVENVARGPSLWYNDPIIRKRKLYISDFLIGNTIYEIKSKWTWNKKGLDLDLETTNKEKLKQAIAEGYNVILVLDGEEINARFMG